MFLIFYLIFYLKVRLFYLHLVNISQFLQLFFNQYIHNRSSSSILILHSYLEIQHQILILVNCELYLSLKIKLFDGNLQFLFHPF
jgi:hypothetical protein